MDGARLLAFILFVAGNFVLLEQRRINKMQKTGVVFQVDIKDFFNPLNDNHVKAYLRWKATGLWPAGFLNDRIYLGWGYEKVLEKAMEGITISDTARMYTDELKRVSEVIGAIEYPGYRFVVEPLEDRFTVHVEYTEPDIVTGKPELQKGRPLLLGLGETQCQLVQAAFRCLLASMEHRCREWFRWRGEQVMCPHRDLESLFQNETGRLV